MFLSFLGTDLCLLRMHLLILILILFCHLLVFSVFVRECFFLFQLIEFYLMKMYLLFFSDSVFSGPPSCLELLLSSVSGGSADHKESFNILVTRTKRFFFFLT